jgi:GNAT superfamily N-acetyltransferase
MTLRELEPDRDADGVVALVRAASPTAVISSAAWLHRVATIPPRARQRGWVAEEEGRIVGNAYAMLNFFSEDASTALVGVNVSGAHRGRGIGSQLYDLVAGHAREIEALSILTTFPESDEAVAFAHGRGFREVRAEVDSALDPRTVTERPQSGLDVRAVADVDPRLVYTVDIEATRDMPATAPIDVVPYDEWEDHVLAHPLFAAEGSFVVIVDGVAAALSLLLVDAESGRATSMFTGTLRDYRGRGLGLAAKLASIEWAVANGVTQLVTTNDETNAPMLAINRRLGYKPAGRRVDYLRDLSGTAVAAETP